MQGNNNLTGFDCSGGAVLTVVELLEEAGLPQLCIAVAEEADAQRVLGEMFAEAIKVSNHYQGKCAHVILLSL